LRWHQWRRSSTTSLPRRIVSNRVRTLLNVAVIHNFL
jgi:hypothetical protein